MGTKIFLSILLTSIAFARGGGGCLVEGSQIGTASASVAIEKIGSSTALASPHGLVNILDRIQFQAGEVYLIKLPSAEIRATADHPFFINSSELVSASFLHAGQRLLKFDGSSEEILAIQKIQGNFTVYNLVLPAPGVFSVQGFLTHNKGCFVPDTQIQMADGTIKKISDVQIGDEVLGFDSEDQVVSTKVRQIFSITAEQIYDLTFENGEHVRATAEHPFYVGSGHFRLVESLRVGDSIQVLTREGLKPSRIVAISLLNQKTPVFNLQTDEPHTFFAAQIAVHNKGGGGGGFHSGSFHRTGGYRGGAYHNAYRYSSTGVCYDEQGKQVTCDSGWYIVFGLGFFIAMIFVFAKLLKGSESTPLDTVISGENISKRANLVEPLLQEALKKNPEVNLTTLNSIVQKAFLTLQEVWEARNYSKMKSLVFEDLAEFHQEQIKSMIRNHEINKLSNIKIHFIRFVHFELDSLGQVEVITVIIEAEMVDQYIDDRTQRHVRGYTVPETFQEIWNFQKLEGKWLLRDIEQTADTSVFSRPLPEISNYDSVAGSQKVSSLGMNYSKLELRLAELSRTDRAWNLVQLRSQAQKVGMNFVLAHESLSVEKLNGYLTNSFYSFVTNQIEELIRQNSHWEFRNLCLRSSEVIAVESKGKYGDRVAFRLIFHAQRLKVENGITVQEDPMIKKFKLELWLTKSGEQFLLDDVAMEF